jgi:hypothetical protein
MKTVEQVKEEMIKDIKREIEHLTERLEENNTKLGILNRSKL